MNALQGKVAVVTGAGQGVGQGIALALATEGVSVAVVGRTVAKLDETCALLRERGVRAEAYALDLLDTDAIAPLVDRIAGDFGRLDVLVNNAYDGVMMPLLDMSQKNFTKGFVTGPFAAFAFMKAAHPHLVAAGGGSIVNLVTSAMVRWDPTNYGAYAAAKTALRSLTRTAAVEWAPDGIRVNSVAPHALSPGLKWWTETHPEEAAEFVAAIPMKRIGDPEADIGRAVVALVGPDLAYLTGATVPLDGGQAHF
ncbi:SDR family oxidoreductase [Pimelobacter simplex]|uniref:SDR family NAD(P)-dependent oxidoreductase n=1 Tax=Nocardioides simplex TaxID=2045 RepID=UPI000535B409|nr:SDR family oxidoreductase [Pimelobacter simplex]MCG8153539.1 SDR family oxidoreductase [Pimelobacter simplex]GEB15796.1 short-chain dehydrogenase [Pimelobacter simplex]